MQEITSNILTSLSRKIQWHVLVSFKQREKVFHNYWSILAAFVDLYSCPAILKAGGL